MPESPPVWLARAQCHRRFDLSLAADEACELIQIFGQVLGLWHLERAICKEHPISLGFLGRYLAHRRTFRREHQQQQLVMRWYQILVLPAEALVPEVNYQRHTNRDLLARGQLSIARRRTFR